MEGFAKQDCSVKQVFSFVDTLGLLLVDVGVVMLVMLVVLHHVDEILYFGYRYRSIDLVLTMY